MIREDFIFWNNFWNQHGTNVPWEIDAVDNNLIDFLQTTKIQNMLEIGCGSGINSIWASDKALHVTAIDISHEAINIAKTKNTKSNIHFKDINFFDWQNNCKYDFIFDRGCFHGLKLQDERKDFVKKIADVIEERGKWLSIIGSAENIFQNEGPPRHTLSQIVTTIEPFLKIIQIKECFLKNKNGILSPAWFVVSSKRLIQINKTFG